MLIASVGLILAGVVQLFVSIRAADGRLGRNRIAGIRTRATMLTDDTWRTAHQAAKPLGLRAGQAFLLSGLIIPVARVGKILGLVGLAFGIICLYRSTRAGVRAVTEISRTGKAN